MRCFSLWLVLLCCGCIASACGPSLYFDESRLALFRPGIDDMSGLEPFYYSERFLNSQSPDPAGLDYKRNCKEWQTFTGPQVNLKDIYEIQYRTSPDNFALACKTGDWQGFEDNTFVQWLRQKKNKAALDYMSLAKQSEYAQFNDGDPWTPKDYGTPAGKAFGLTEQVAATAAVKCWSIPDPFLRERYAFQLLKSLYYLGGHEDSVATLYKQYFAGSRSVLKGWTELYYGMTLVGKQRTYYLLQSFDHSEEKKVFCYHHISLKDLDTLEWATRDKHTLMLIYTMRAMRMPGHALPVIRKVYQLEPSSPYLPFLVSREINKIEDWIWSPEVLDFYSVTRQNTFYSLHPSLYRWGNDYDSYAAKNLQKDEAYLATVKAFLMGIGKGRNRDFYSLSVAHLDNVGRNYQAAVQRLQAMNVLPDKAMETQRLLDLALATAYTQDVLQAATKQRLAVYIQNLQQLNPVFLKQNDTTWKDFGEEYDAFGTSTDAEQKDDLAELMLMLSMRYKEKGDRVTAGLLYNKANITTNNYDGDFLSYDYSDGQAADAGYKYIAYYDREAVPQDIDRLLAFKKRGPRTDFERLITPFRWSLDDHYLDLKGTLLMRQKKYREALEVFSSMAPDFWQEHYVYKYYLPARDIRHLGTFTPWDTTRATRYVTNSKQLIAADIVALLDRIDTETNSERLAELYTRMGNAQYSLTYYGKAWMMISYGQSSYEGIESEGDFAWFTFYPNNKRYRKDYYECSEAIRNYKKALSLTHNEERKAAILFMLGVCDKAVHGAQLNREAYYRRQKEYISPYFRLAKRRYKQTYTYDQALSFCPDINW